MRPGPARADDAKKIVGACPRSRSRSAYWAGMNAFTERSRGLIEAPGTAPTDLAQVLRGLSDADLLRLKALARLWSRGLPGDVGWADILNEAFVRVLDGSRPWPPGVPLVAFLSGVMRSLCDDQWRRVRRERDLLVRRDDAETDEEVEPACDPDRVLVAAQELAAIHRLFAADPPVLEVISGLADGLSAREICRLHGLSERDYDSIRKRMRRALLRAGLVRGAR